VDAKVTTPAPRFDMDELAKVIKEAVQVTTRELVGSYGLGPGPSSALGQPPQAPVIERYAVSSGSQSRPQFQGRGYPFGGQGGGYQQLGGQGSGQQQATPYQQQPFGGQYQPQSGQQFGGQPQYRQLNITCYNCEERGHGYQQCPKPPQSDETLRAIYERVNGDKPWSYNAYNSGQQQRDRYQPPHRRSTDASRPPFVGSSFSTQDARVSDPPASHDPRVSEVNLVEEMRFPSALDGVTVDVSMIEEIYAVTKREADRSGPESDASDARITKKVVQSVQPSQPAVRVVAEAVAEVPAAGPSSILERPRAAAYSRKQPVVESAITARVSGASRFAMELVGCYSQFLHSRYRGLHISSFFLYSRYSGLHSQCGGLPSRCGCLHDCTKRRMDCANHGVLVCTHNGG
jgi:hypothetical protein